MSWDWERTCSGVVSELRESGGRAESRCQCRRLEQPAAGTEERGSLERLTREALGKAGEKRKLRRWLGFWKT